MRRPKIISPTTSPPAKHPGSAMCWLTATSALVAVKTPFDELAVEGLRGLPADMRAWDGVDKIWRVNPVCFEQARAVLDRRFELVVVHESVEQYLQDLARAERRSKLAELRRASPDAEKLVDLNEVRKRLGGGAG